LIPRYNTAQELIESTFSRYADLPAFTCLGQTHTFKDIDRKSLQFASYLHHELGLKPGDCFAIQLPNILQFPIALYGAVRAGLVLVNVNPLYTPREIKHQLVDAGAKALLVLSNVANNAAKIINETQVEHVIVTDIGDEHGFPKRQLINFVIRKIKKMVPDFSFDNCIQYGEIFSHKTREFTIPESKPDDLLLLQYTGGTTGVSKGAMLLNKNLMANVWQMITHMPKAFSEGKEVWVACLPSYHIYALNLHIFSAFSRGEHNLLIPNPRDFMAFAKALKPYNFSVFIGINTLYTALIRSKEFMALDFSALKICAAGGMALTEDTANSWEKHTGCKVTEGYGLTETSPVLTGNLCDDIQLGTIGLPLPETEISILDDDGVPVADGEVGELCAKGPQVMPAYWNRPEETKDAFTADGYFKTGDMAIKRDDGCFKIIDRKKDMILVSGFNVYPIEIEDVITANPKVVEAAAIGIDNGEGGEIVKAFVVKDDPSLTEEELINYCRKNLTRYKVPKIIEFRDDLPKSNVGKILRKELRE
jgi:long-chain acyl-CoA synthetase